MASFPDIIASEAKEKLPGYDLPERFSLTFRWSKHIWRDSAVWPFGSEHLFIRDRRNIPSAVQVKFVEKGG